MLTFVLSIFFPVFFNATFLHAFVDLNITFEVSKRIIIIMIIKITITNK